MRPMLVAIALLWAFPAQAVTVLIETAASPLRPGLDNQGWWPPTIGYSNSIETDIYWANSDSVVGSEVRNFFSFRIPAMLFEGMEVVGATLWLTRYDSAGNDAEVTFSLFDVTSDLATLMHNVGHDLAVWNDLGSGTSYGSFDVPVAGNPAEVLPFVLNAAALADIAAAAGDYFTVGGAVTSGVAQLFFGSGAAGTQALAIDLRPVSAPANLPVIATGLLFLMAVGRVRRLPWRKPAF